MTARERLQMAYEFAFNPKMLHAKWRGWLKDPQAADPDELKALDEAAMLHLPLPEKGMSSRALFRLAIYRAAACDYRMRTFITALRRRLNRPALVESEVPVGMVRDVVLTHYHEPSFPGVP